MKRPSKHTPIAVERNRTPRTDLELLEAWRAGEQRAADELMRRYYAALYRFFEIKVPGVAEDLTQKTLLACVEKKNAVTEHAGFRPYLFGIARKLLLRYLRDRSRHDSALRFDDPGPSSLQTPSQIVATRQEQRLLLAALDKLPIDLQIAVVLFYWEGMRTPEIGAVLEIPTSTVTSRLARARTLVREYADRLALDDPAAKSVADHFEQWARSLLATVPVGQGDGVAG